MIGKNLRGCKYLWPWAFYIC